jgi:hypothetical protein
VKCWYFDKKSNYRGSVDWVMERKGRGSIGFSFRGEKNRSKFTFFKELVTVNKNKIMVY